MELPKSTTFFCGEGTIEIRQQKLEQLKQAATKDRLRRARLCLHHNHSDKLQEMIIVFCQDSYVAPHRQVNKWKSCYVIEGQTEVIFFDTDGQVTRRITMGSFGSGCIFLCRFSSTLWHMLVPLTKFVVLLETTTGPFVGGVTEFPGWAPDEADVDAVKAFLSRIRA